jgi:16S rRNA (uracil1498-N3)-methyltransferase
MADRFYTPDPLRPGEHVLRGDEAHHLVAVRRFAPGDRVTLFNGDGHEYPAEILSCSKKSVTLAVHAAEIADREWPFPLVVACALPKSDRADFLIEKLTELGVSRFVPLITQRTVVRPRPEIVEKFGRAVIEASKQCGRNRLLAVDPPREWAAFVGSAGLPDRRLLLHTAPGLSTAGLSSPEGAVIAVGPEGGFTPEEVAAGVAKGWRGVSLGPRVLRVETAAVAAAALVSAGWVGAGFSSPADAAPPELP